MSAGQKFSVICADPPWAFSDRLEKMKSKTRRSAASQYSTLTCSELKRLDVGSLADPLGCTLVMWVPSTLLQHGMDVMSAWGFAHKQTLPWVKTKYDPLKALKADLKKRVEDYVLNGNTHEQAIEDAVNDFDLNATLAFGMGRLFRQTHELALIGTSGKSVYTRLKSKSQRSVIFAPNAGHSIKPEELQDRLEVMFPDVPKLEMFARRNRVGWTCIGDGVTGKDIKLSIAELTCPAPPAWVGEPCGVYGCVTPKNQHAGMCDSCFEDYRKDPDAYK